MTSNLSDMVVTSGEGNGEFSYQIKQCTRRTVRYGLYAGKRQISFADFIRVLKSEQRCYSLISMLIKAITDATEKLGEFSWECPPVTGQTKSNKFEFVVIKSDTENSEQDVRTFRQHFLGCEAPVCSFSNRTGDATLISPVPVFDDFDQFLDFKNISNFTKNADFDRQCILWRRVAVKLEEELQDGQPRWLSSNNQTVQYFHIRIDRKPKHYVFKGYSNWMDDNSALMEVSETPPRPEKKDKICYNASLEVSQTPPRSEKRDKIRYSAPMEVSQTPPRPEKRDKIRYSAPVEVSQTPPKLEKRDKIRYSASMEVSQTPPRPEKRDKIQSPEPEEESKQICKISRSVLEEYGGIHHECTRESQDVLRYRFKYGQHPLTFDTFIEMMRSERHSVELAKNLGRALTDANKKLKAFFWECPPVIYNSKSSQQFEFIVNQSDSLNRIRQDFSPFNEHFRRCHDKACSFVNLGGDAHLVSPKPARGPIGQYLDYKNLSTFAVNSDFETQLCLWRLVASKLDEELKDLRPRWLSTNGLGVHYLHIRIDKKPKYYTFTEYACAEVEQFPKKKKKYDDGGASSSKSWFF